VIGGAEREIVLRVMFGLEVPAADAEDVAPRCWSMLLNRSGERSRFVPERGSAPLGGVPRSRAVCLSCCGAGSCTRPRPETAWPRRLDGLGNPGRPSASYWGRRHQPVGEAQGEGDHVLVLREVLVSRLGRELFTDSRGSRAGAGVSRPVVFVLSTPPRRSVM